MITKIRLTKREAEILQLIAWGRSEKEIGYDFGIAQSTVNNTKQNIYHKTGLNKDTELVAFYYCNYKGELFDIDPLSKIAKAVLSVMVCVFTLLIFENNDLLARRMRRMRNRKDVDVVELIT